MRAGLCALWSVLVPDTCASGGHAAQFHTVATREDSVEGVRCRLPYLPNHLPMITCTFRMDRRGTRETARAPSRGAESAMSARLRLGRGRYYSLVKMCTVACAPRLGHGEQTY